MAKPTENQYLGVRNKFFGNEMEGIIGVIPISKQLILLFHKIDKFREIMGYDNITETQFNNIYQDYVTLKANLKTETDKL